MTHLRRLPLLLAIVVLFGCANKPPLPEAGPPADFLFIYTEESPKTNARPGSGSGSAGTARPVKLRVSIDGAGTADVEATYMHPHLTRSKSSLTLSGAELRTFYDTLVGAKLYPMQDQWVGEQADLGRQTYFVMGNGKSKTLTVDGTEVPELSRIRSAVLGFIPDLEPPAEDDEARVVMDTRTKTFHASSDPHIAAIPMEFRKQYAHQYEALNDGGQPCPDFGKPAGK